MKVVASLVLLIAVSGFTITTFLSDIAMRRLSTITQQIATRDLNGRVDIWQRGLDAFVERPLAGVGAGAFANAVGARRSRDIAAHNSLLGILVEHGLIGACLFVGIVLTLYRRARRRPTIERRLWLVVLTAWCVAASTLSWENREITWLLWSLCASHPLLRTIRIRNIQRSPYVVSPSTA